MLKKSKETVDLKEEQLDKVSGGFTKNPDGTFNLRKYEVLSGKIYTFTILQDYYNLMLNDRVFVEYGIRHAHSTDNGQDYRYLKDIFSYVGIDPNKY